MGSLKEFRLHNKLRQIDIADFLGVNVSFITNIESGRSRLPGDKLELLMNNDRGWTVEALSGAEYAVIQGRSVVRQIEDLKRQLQEEKERSAKYLEMIERLIGKIEV